MNWGIKIVVGLATFMLFIIGAGVYMITQDSDSLLDEDYYEKSLVYDEVYERKQNVVDDRAKPIVRLEQDTLAIVFTSPGNEGQLSFKRPSDGQLDKKIPLYTATEVFKLPISSFTKGSWLLEISWENEHKTYIDTRTVYIQ
ncbi:hypothetical protein G5B30_00535 [Sphingobacterium sp. SGG-5]|uniref:FixH family protein n=1 Tax=Sphingobacterium sp. SGG-5 TaxID=2710881 RepID=UPI0013ED42B0|nr:FixH family protein [Sphingobacterium sp. SGG-5]NGM60390.1 hypothetical protein [Sphingobacterium sp. SGG-5]